MWVPWLIMPSISSLMLIPMEPSWPIWPPCPIMPPEDFSGRMVMSCVMYIGITIRVIQSVGAYMMSSMYMFIDMSLGTIEHLCVGPQPRSTII